MKTQTPTQTAPLALAKGAISVFSDTAATRIRCEKGVLWLTQDNDPRDIVLAAGDQFQPDRRGNVVVYALEAAAFSWGPVPAAVVAESPWNALATWLTAHFSRRLATFAPRRHAFE